MIYAVVCAWLCVMVMIYLNHVMDNHIDFLKTRLDISMSDHNKLLCNVSRLLSRSRVALDGRLIVPRKVYDNFMEQSFDNEEVDYEA